MGIAFKEIPASSQVNRRTANLEGSSLGAGISSFHVTNDPGEGPELHTHPYSEAGVVLTGRALLIADDEQIDARQGDIMTVTAGTPHTFRNVGDDRLEPIYFHASPNFITSWLDKSPGSTP